MCRCPNCGLTFGIEENTEAIPYKYCDTCAVKVFNVDVGMEFLAYAEFEEEFYLSIAWAVNIYHVDKNHLIEILKKEFRQQTIEISRCSESNMRIDQLKRYCFHDMEKWIEFVSDRAADIVIEKGRTEKWQESA